jgi:hypothetical protein
MRVNLFYTRVFNCPAMVFRLKPLSQRSSKKFQQSKAELALAVGAEPIGLKEA